MNIPDALAELGAQIGLSDLALDENGLARVVFDGTLTVDFESMDEGRVLHLSSVVAALDGSDREEALFERLLQANLLGIATGGAHFSISEGDGEVLLERKLPVEVLACSSFVNAVETFVNHLEGWKE